MEGSLLAATADAYDTARNGVRLMAARRTTLLLDDVSAAAARQLAESPAFQRKVGQRRAKTLKRLFEMFEGNNAAEEVRRLKTEDQGF